ncbi:MULTISPECIES: hypothetical protein [Pantoea]|uniref:hypothetical protein n=1 Tax=Pantoea TaxID=53335 RepID=UPI00080B1606|nr:MULTISPECIES: hypothetical protein [Pantoea]MDU2730505.1 hypothetical protein [Pantoea sp.]MDU6090031.1 hypothetical protein [Staphylococcus lugdunensis]DAW17471.1 MAG TPA: hypothetical protein [Caudoviricetes sp.]
MGTVKQNCHYVPRQPTVFRLKGVHPDWEMHPNYVNAVESLDAYNLWVCEVVLPIAFQWIQEHKDEVYANIPDDERDDVGVVVAAAFELIKNLDSFKNGSVEADNYEKEINNGTFNPDKTNPVWSEISKEIRSSTDAIFARRKNKLKSTIK